MLTGVRPSSHDLQTQDIHGSSIFVTICFIQFILRRGREYESVYVNHHYTGEELKVLASYETLNYLPPDSKAYR